MQRCWISWCIFYGFFAFQHLLWIFYACCWFSWLNRCVYCPDGFLFSLWNHSWSLSLIINHRRLSWDYAIHLRRCAYHVLRKSVNIVNNLSAVDVTDFKVNLRTFHLISIWASMPRVKISNTCEQLRLILYSM